MHKTQNKLSLIQSEKSDLEETRDRLLGEIQTLKESLIEYQGINAAHATNFHKEKDILEKKCKELAQQIIELKEELEEQADVNLFLNNQIKEDSARIVELQNETIEFESKNVSLKGEIFDLQKSSENEIMQLKQRCTQTEEQLKVANTELQSKIGELLALERSSDENNLKVNDLGNALDDYRKKEIDLRSQISLLSQSNQNLESIKENNNSQIKDLSTRIEILRKQLTESREAVSKLEVSVTDLNTISIKQNEKILMLEEEIVEKSLHLKNSEKVSQKLSDALDNSETLKSIADELFLQLDHAHLDSSELKEKLLRSEQEVSELRSRCDDITAERSNHQSYITEIKCLSEKNLLQVRRITELEQAITDLRSSLEELGSVGEKNQNLQIKYEVLESENKVIKDKNSRLQAEIIDLQQQITESISGSENDKLQEDSRVKEMASHIELLQHQKRLEIEKFKKLDATFEKLEADHKLKIVQLEKYNYELENRISDLERNNHKFICKSSSKSTTQRDRTSSNNDSLEIDRLKSEITQLRYTISEQEESIKAFQLSNREAFRMQSKITDCNLLKTFGDSYVVCDHQQQAEISNMKLTIQELVQKVTERDKEIESLLKRIHSFKGIIEDLREKDSKGKTVDLGPYNQHRLLVNENESLRKEKISLKLELQSMIIQHKTKIQQLEQRIEEMSTPLKITTVNTGFGAKDIKGEYKSPTPKKRLICSLSKKKHEKLVEVEKKYENTKVEVLSKKVMLQQETIAQLKNQMLNTPTRNKSPPDTSKRYEKRAMSAILGKKW